MATNFPGGIDTFPPASPTSGLDNPSHSGLHNDLGDGLTAVQTQLVNQPYGLVHIKTVSTGGAVASVDITDCFSNDYYAYRINYDLIGSTTLQSVAMRVLSGTTPNTSSQYRRQIAQFSSTSNESQRITGETFWRATRVYSTSKMLGYSEIYWPYQSQRTQLLNFNTAAIDGNIIWTSEMLSLDVTTSYDGFQIFVGTGNFDGSVTVLGYKA